MAQNREPPAFQEYASSMMARADYRLLSLAERGLLYSMRLECWVNSALPSDPGKLAKILGFNESEITSALPGIRPFFSFDGHSIVCPELLDYRKHLDGIRDKQRAGGEKGAKEKREKKSSSNLEVDLKVDLKVDRKVSSIVKQSPNQSNPASVEDLSLEHQSFVSAMESSETNYAKASNGY